MQSIMLALAFAGAAQPNLPTASSDEESAQTPVASQAADDVGQDPVSYTHLTLPTKA